MTMKLPRKLLSCLLVIAICITTVFGCLITASAETAPSYTIADGVVNADLTEATVDVTFNVPSGMSVGYFDVVNYNNSYAAVTAVVKDGTPDDIDVFINTDDADLDEGDLAIIGFQVMGTEKDDSGEDVAKLYTSVTLTLTFTFAGGTATKGNDYKIIINDLDFSGRYAAVTGEWSGNEGVIKTGCDHIVTVDEADLVKTDSVNGYSVYSDSTCSVCGDPDNELGYQVVPTAVPSEEKVIYWSGNVTSASSFDELGGSGTETNPYIIDSAEDLALLVRATIDSTDKHFKVADGISAIVLQKESDEAKAIMSLNSAAAVQKYFEDGNIASPLTWTNNGWSSSQFKGTLDGNGATVYGLYYNDPSEDYTAGLFGSAANYTVKNLTVKNSYIQILTLTGVIIGCQRSGTGTLEQCAVANCYIRQHMSEDTKNTATNKAAIMANNWSGTVDINNCMVYGNDARNVGFTNTEDGVGFALSMISSISNSKDPVDSITNCVCLGATPYQQYNSGSNNFVSPNSSPYINVYTDQAIDGVSMYRLKDGAWEYLGKLSTVISNSLTATTMAEFKTQEFVDSFNANAQSTVLAVDVNGGYPTFAPDVVKIDDTENVQYLAEQLASNYTPTFITEAEEGVGTTEDNPYIIESLTDLYGLAKVATYAQTKDKYFKLSDDLDVLVLQKKAYVETMGDGDEATGLKKLKNMTADEAETYLSTTSTNRQTWWNGSTITYSDENNKVATAIAETSTVFAGTIDFNGVEIYGLYNTGGGLFKYVNNATFKNLTIKSSYVISDTAGVIASSGTYGPADGIINIENCTVANNAVVSQRKNNAISNGGVMVAGMGDNVVNINNCLVYGNTAKHQGYFDTITGYDITYGLIGSAGSYNTSDEDGNTVTTYSSVTNSIILDCVPHGVNYAYATATNMTFSNVYTNVVGTTITNIDFGNSGADKYKFTISPTIDANGRYYPYIYRYINDTANGSITGYEPTGSVIATTADDITGLAANGVVTTLNTANDGKAVWGCTANGYPTPMAAYADTINSVSSADLQLAAYNLTYNEGGSFNLNFHYEPAYTGFEPELYVAQADLSGFTKLAAQESSYANNGLSEYALMYVIENISAREIADTMLPTVVAANGDQAIWGKTESISVKDYAIDVINGEAVYTEDATEEKIQQDKNVAAAIINYGEAAKKALETSYDGSSAVGITDKWSGGWSDTTLADDDDGSGDGSSWEEAIIINSADELAYLCKTGDDDSSSGKYYKVADGIAAFDMNVTTDDDMSGDMTAEEVKAIFDGKKAGATWWSDKAFKGHFDGNGVIVYGLYSKDQSQAALFPRVSVASGNVTIKNITVKNSYFYGDSAAPLVAQESSWTTNTVYIENCQAYDNYCVNYRKNDAINNGGHLVCYISSVLNVNNCFVSGNTVMHRGYYDDITTYNIPEYSFFGYNNHKNSVISNTIMLGCTPISLNNFANGMQPDNFSNVYTDTMPDGSSTVYRTEVSVDTDGDEIKETTYEKNDSYVTRTYTDNGNGTFSIAWSGETVNGAFTLNYDYNCSDTDTQIKVISADDIRGSAAVATMPNLDWSKWAYGMSGEYPTPITSVAASDEKVISSYSGTPATSIANVGGGDGSSAENAIIISSADELAYLANGADGLTAGKYYAIDPSIDAMVLQPSDYAEDIMALDTTDKVKSYFETNASKMKKWATSAAAKTYESTQESDASYGKVYHFGGLLNGNGVAIYGLYANGASSTGLFPYSWNITVENIAIKNSYTYGDKAGLISSMSYYGSKDNIATLSVKNCEFTNNVLLWNRNNDSANAGGLLTGSNSGEQTAWSGKGGATASAYTYGYYGAQVEGCVIYGNVVCHTDTVTHHTKEYDIDGGLFGQVHHQATSYVKNSIVLDTMPGMSWASNYRSVAVKIENVYSNLVGKTLNHTDWTGSGATELSYTTELIDNGDGTVTINYKTDSATYTATATMTSISAADVMGDKAMTKASALGWVKDGGVWYPGNDFSLPSLTEKAGVMPTANQMAFDALTMTNYDAYTATDPEFSMYATSLNLKANPYIAFTFAFNGDYKTNRDNIKVRFSREDGSSILPTTDENPDGYITVGNGKGGVNAGWTNNAGAGRYHLYRLENVAVEDLCNPITVTVKYGDNEAVTFGTFSVEGFALDIQNAYKQDPCEYYATRVEAAKALLYYTQMINARYGSVA